AAQRLPHPFQVERQIGCKGDVLKGQRQQLLAGVAEDVAQALVHAQPPSTWIDMVDAHRRVLERGAEAFIGLTQSKRTLLVRSHVAEAHGHAALLRWIRVDREPPAQVRAKRLTALQAPSGARSLIGGLEW